MNNVNTETNRVNNDISNPATTSTMETNMSMTSTISDRKVEKVAFLSPRKSKSITGYRMSSQSHTKSK